MRLIQLAAVAALVSMLAAGCTYYSTFGFPVEEGNIDAGRQVFVDYRCHLCHSVAGERLPEPAGNVEPMLELGGETTRVKAYSELVSSIMNPDHVISERYLEQLPPPESSSESPMPDAHIDRMTLRELIDVVAFLDSRYVLLDDYER